MHALRAWVPAVAWVGDKASRVCRTRRAPPRQQLIFHPHMRVTKSEALCKQNHRCAGCGLSVERSYVSSFKYCEYIGRYFCSSCHSKTLHPIPARILWKWDFRSYPISKFARDLLRRIWGDPLFNVADVNCNLYARARPLQNARELRLQLQLVRTYLASCTSDSVTLRELNVTIPEDVDVYSMRQLVGVRDGTFLTYLHDLIHEGVKHVRTCVLCTAKGFICELCNANQIIFPFETGLTMQCRQCQACYHSKCWARHGHCPKCRRCVAICGGASKRLPVYWRWYGCSRHGLVVRARECLDAAVRSRGCLDAVVVHEWCTLKTCTGSHVICGGMRALTRRICLQLCGNQDCQVSSRPESKGHGSSLGFMTMRQPRILNRESVFCTAISRTLTQTLPTRHRVPLCACCTRCICIPPLHSAGYIG